MTQCSSCQRHFFACEPACPFCRESESGLSRHVQRAAVVGAAALIMAGCLPGPAPVYGAPAPPLPSPSASPSGNPAP